MQTQTQIQIQGAVCDDRLFVWFPYNQRVMQIIKQFRGYKWHADRKMWSIPAENANHLYLAMKREGFLLQKAESVPKVFTAPRVTEPVKPGTIRTSRLAFKRCGGELQLMFRYDAAMKNLIKSLPRRWWHNGTEEGDKYWGIPYADLGLLKEALAAAKWTGKLWDDDFDREEPLAAEDKMQFGSTAGGDGEGKPEDPEERRLRELAEIELQNRQRQEHEEAEFEEAFRRTAVPDIDISDVRFRALGDNVMSHQMDFMRFAKAKLTNDPRGILVCDEQGLGKTLESINLALYQRETLGIRHCLIICCVNSTVRNWADEIIMHTNGEEVPLILGQKMHRDGSYSIGGSKEKLHDLELLAEEPDAYPFFLIINIEAMRMTQMVQPDGLSNRAKKRRKNKPKKIYPIEKKITELIRRDVIGTVIIDEVHKNTSPQSQQGRLLWRIHRNTEGKGCWVPMTGTPLVNQPKDLFLPLGLAGGHDFTNFYAFRDYFCPNDAKTITQCKHLGELRLMLVDKMIRRTKEEAIDLPPKIQRIEYVSNTAYQKTLYTQVANEIAAEIEDENSGFATMPNPLSMLLKLRQVNGSPELIDEELDPADSGYLQKNAKLKRLLELVKEILDNGEKAIIFSNWEKPLGTLVRYLKELTNVAVITGSVKGADRQEQKMLFQEDPSFGIVCGTIGALGTGLTLTAATHVIFYDEPWTPSDKQQAEDRAHRIGTTGTIYVHTLIAEDTVDQRVHDAIYSKKQTADLLVDGHMQVGGREVNITNDRQLIMHLIFPDRDYEAA